jgi:hypothetical protein
MVDSSRGLPAGEKYARFYQTRFRIMVGLGGFILVLGLPLAGIPPLRHRLHDRVQTLREALGGEPQPKSVTAKVGENTNPFPPEFERKVEPLKQPTYGGVIALPNQVYNPSQPYTLPSARNQAPPSSQASAVTGRSTAKRKVTIPAPEEPVSSAVSSREASEPASTEPQFRQGTIEKECYDLLLQSSATVRGMVGGNDPALRFKDWSAAKMEDGSYLVRVNFTKSGAEETYIWQVKPETKQVFPLNFNARALPK